MPTKFEPNNDSGSVKLQSRKKKSQKDFKSNCLIDISVGREWLMRLPVWKGMREVIFLLDMTHYERLIGDFWQQVKEAVMLQLFE